MSIHRFRSAAVALVLAAAAASPALAQRVIRIVVPFGPGAVQDTIARTFNAELGQQLGASVIVENRPGAGGTVGTGAAAKATDNNTLVLAAASHTLAGHLYSKLPYDPVKDFVGVAYVGNTGYVIAAPGNLGVNSLADYVKLVKSQPGKLNYASAGNGSATHLGMAYFLAKAGVEMQHVPMKSTGDAVNEVLAGRVQGVTSSLIGVTGFKNDPRIKILAYTGAQRSKFMPELPTAAEQGVPGYKFDSWIGVLAPASLPRAEAEKINAAMQKVLAMPVIQERLANLGVEPGAMSVDDFQKLLRADYEQAGVLVKASGARIE
ncbi:tripartite tricarboxylate transporter substrate binding protein [Ramlibacter sp. USB13]|uniref:Tripartite tricarboxylate transporter substrate binding protein n=1 Tax=Ramlibacter cellulosilyticus TaxID=2764187 RepID=A0A923MUV9_9BURK|nr:tripartite tricarboxylate transporter substrate-binding protein [Ramlibacter cellulosilyticus]MBC5785163.1 tripartite tricarboxylate transporter substrate binding protein [Ramlibacter cellulosilyticus]